MIDRPTAAVRPMRGRSRPSWPLWVGLALLLVAVSVVVWSQVGGASVSGRSATARVGSAAPEISLPQLINGQRGAPAKLSSFVGHPVVLNFWATWCVPCRDEFPTFEAKYRQYQASNQLIVLGVDAESDGGPAAAQQFVREMGASFPIWLDVDGEAEQAYRVQALPTTAFIDRNGVIQDLIVGGPLTAEYLEKDLKRIF